MSTSQTSRTSELKQPWRAYLFYAIPITQSERLRPRQVTEPGPISCRHLHSPASLAQRRMEVTSFPCVVLHWPRCTAALTPKVPSLAFTPHK